MSTPKRGLGRGLGALLGAPSAPLAPPPSRGLINVPVAAIAPNPHQPRTTFAAEALEELRASIAEFGVLVPIIVRRLAGERYELIAGERRWRASVAAGLETIPALVRNADDRESLEVAIIENLQRENLDPLEEAMGFAHLMETYAFTQEQVAQRVIGASTNRLAQEYPYQPGSAEQPHCVLCVLPSRPLRSRLFRRTDILWLIHPSSSPVHPDALHIHLVLLTE